TKVDNATLLTGTSGATALTKTTDFTVEARFDLIVPDDLSESYGIRLTDRLPGDTVGGSTGNDVLELKVVKGNSGSLVVQLRDIDFTTGTVTTLQSIGLNLPGGILDGDQILLRLL